MRSAAIGKHAMAKVADVSREDDVLALRDATLAAHGRIDVLVNNAGINPIYRGIEKTGLDDWSNIVAVNLTGVFLCCKHLGGWMAAHEGGSVINITSVAGHVGLRRSVPYCAAKGGVELMTKALALDWAEKGVRVNAIAPGYFETDLTAGMRDNAELSGRLLAQTRWGASAAGRYRRRRGVPGVRRVRLYDRPEPADRRRLDGGVTRTATDAQPSEPCPMQGDDRHRSEPSRC